ncbi:hypothetical protein EVAR_52622_1 [Eumeta japonica]|uniref:Uncharacterized protein n=1 Tax=Eumeta variegata TaxID=151549 RepID=A0A4C1XWY1_EUMVA|nr:hypothetical protein EVAR_52622_1 [Eumeta japonica]
MRFYRVRRFLFMRWFVAVCVSTTLPLLRTRTRTLYNMETRLHALYCIRNLLEIYTKRGRETETETETEIEIKTDRQRNVEIYSILCSVGRRRGESARTYEFKACSGQFRGTICGRGVRARPLRLWNLY